MKAASLQVLLILKVLCLVTLAGGQPKAALKCSRECKKFTSKIEAKRIRSYHRTEASCKKQAIILVTLKLMEICADPDAEWVKKVIKELGQEKVAASPLPHSVASAEDPGGVQKLVGVTAPAGLSQGTSTPGLDKAFVPAATTEIPSTSLPAPQNTTQLRAGLVSVTQGAAALPEVTPEAGRGSLMSLAASPAAAEGRVSSQPTLPVPGSASATGAAGGAAGHAAGTGADSQGTTSPSPHSDARALTEGSDHPVISTNLLPGPPSARTKAPGTASGSFGSDLSSLDSLGHATASATPLPAETTSASAHSSTAATGKAALAHTSRAVSSSADASGSWTSACTPPVAQQDPSDPSLVTSQTSLGQARVQMPTESPNSLPLPNLLPSSQLPLVIPAVVVSALMLCVVAVAWLYLKFGLKAEEVSREMVQGLLYQKAAPPNDAYPMEVI